MEKNYEEILENAKKYSIGSDKKDELKMKVKNVSKQVMTGMLIAAFTISLYGCKTNKRKVEIPENTTPIVTTDVNQISMNDYDFNEMTISPMKTNIIENTRALLWNLGIKTHDQNWNTISNTVETYKAIESLSEDDLIGYYLFLGEQESEKVVMVLGYEGWDDYLTQHGYVDENGKPQIKMWEYSTYEEMQQQLESWYKK